MAVFNLDEVQEQSYIDKEGTYTLKVVKVAEDEDGNTTQLTANGNEYHKYICETQEHERISLSLYLVAKAMWKYKAFLTACGVTTKGMVIDTDEFDPATLVGKKFVGEVRRCADVMDVETGEKVPSKYFEITKFYTVEN